MSLGQAWVDKGFDAVSRAKAWLDDDVKGMTQGQVALVALAGASVGALTTYLRLEGRKGRGRGRRERRRSEGETKTKVTEQPASVVTLPPAPEPAPAPAPAQIEVEEVEEPPKRSAVRGEGDLALRAAGAIKPALSYIDIFLEALGNQWSPSNNTGYIVLLIAENKLTTELVSKRFRQVKSVPDDVFAYNSFRGAPEFRSAVAQYAELTFASGCTIDPEDLSISSGCGAVIDNICFSVCEAGSEVLIPAPYYPAFDNDLRVKSKVEPVPVMPTTTATVAATEEGGGGGAEDKTFLPSNEDLDSAFSKCKNPRILLLTNPHNPMGIVLPPQEIKRCIKWALQKGMHVISDEIYANSIYQPEHHEKFRSAIALMPELSAGEWSLHPWKVLVGSGGQTNNWLRYRTTNVRDSSVLLHSSSGLRAGQGSGGGEAPHHLWLQQGLLLLWA